jgi:hypothetical protein
MFHMDRRQFFSWTLLLAVYFKSKSQPIDDKSGSRLVVLDNWFLLEDDLNRIKANSKKLS